MVAVIFALTGYALIDSAFLSAALKTQPDMLRSASLSDLDACYREVQASKYALVECNPKAGLCRKTVYLGKVKDPTIRRRVGQEAQLLERAKHPNIVRLVRYAVNPDTLVLHMDMVVGQDLFEAIWEGNTRGPAMVAGIGADLASALKYLHAQGIAHCDLKPENIMLSAAGDVKLVDFGSALQCTNLYADYRKRGVFLALGTPGYTAPEVRLGTTCLYNPLAADVYGMGIVLAWMLVQDPEEESWTDALDYAPPGLQDIIVDCTQVRPRLRPSAGQLRKRLADLAAVALALPNNVGHKAN